MSWADSWTTGDWQGAQGKYYFVVDHPGLYRVKIDSTICLVDTLKWGEELWSDTLDVAAGEVIDQGWVITSPCVLNDSVVVDTIPPLATSSAETTPHKVQENNDSPKTSVVEWTIFPNPARNYVRIDIHSDAPLDFRVYDALGRMVRTGEYQRGHTIEIRNLKTGVYFIQLASQDEIIGTKKVLFME